jgi:hypothetical protein
MEYFVSALRSDGRNYCMFRPPQTAVLRTGEDTLPVCYALAVHV